MMRTPMPSKQRNIVEVRERHDGQRLDNFLFSQLKGVPRGHIYRIVRTGQVRVNRGRSRPSHRLHTGDVVRLPPNCTVTRGATDVPAHLTAPVFDVLFEDPYLAVLDKPAGFAVHAGSGIRTGLIEWLRSTRPDDQYIELVHRLDRATSGCLLVAKQPDVLRRLQAGLHAPGDDRSRISKIYLALVEGTWSGGRRRVTEALRKYALRSGERMVTVCADGRPAMSDFDPVRRLRGATLVSVEIFTGRTHQVRVHAAHSGHPVAGDEKYGDRNFNRLMRAHGLERMFLHAWRIGFTHPVTQQNLWIESPLPRPLESVIDRIASDET